MYVCKKCKSHKIKTRSNKSFTKTTSTPVMCRDCGSTEIASVDKKSSGKRRSR